VISKSIVIVRAGEVGVYHLFGKVRRQPLYSGIHFVNPFAEVTRMSIRTEEYTMSGIDTEGRRRGSDAITALTKEGLTISMDITIFFRLDSSMAPDVFKRLGLNYDEKIIRPEIKSTIREVIAQYEAKAIYSEKRIEAGKRILSTLREKLGPRGVLIEDVLLRNVVLPPDLAKAIEQKLKAEQEAERMKFVLKREEQEAERKRIAARGQRDAQSIINESLTPAYLNYLYVKELRNRPGTIYVPIGRESGMPLFKVMK
jgi:regulator of protease activity HflC (stomatin/prohibitin superfamily)